jgi:acyl-CoA synthetase (AMP-forming)/AMP-acid ligase II
MDERGYVRIVGRKKDMIIRGGQNIYPQEIEQFLAAHPRIREAAVVGVPQAIGGERVWAFIIPETSVEGATEAPLTAREVLNYCRRDMNETTNPTLTFNAFRRLIAQTLMLDEEQVTAEADFLNDLMVDSLRLVDMCRAWRSVGTAFRWKRPGRFGPLGTLTGSCVGP